jgi:SAM-dependent methyltransferase
MHYGERMGFREVVASVSSHPKVYEFQRLVLGGRKLDLRVGPVIDRIVKSREPGIVIDVGGGTARSRALWPSDWTYYSIDPDDRMAEIDELGSDVNRVVGSAGSLPFEDAFADVVFMKDTSHHLDDETWAESLNEIRRVLKPDGVFVFLDAVLNPSRHFSVWFWKLDNGKWPRSTEALEDGIRGDFTVQEVERFSLIHNVILVTSINR